LAQGLKDWKMDLETPLAPPHSAAAPRIRGHVLTAVALGLAVALVYGVSNPSVVGFAFPTALLPALQLPGTTPRLPARANAVALGLEESVDSPSRRGFMAAALASSIAAPASAKVDSVNPANNYYFPMAKYRYLPRILRAWIAIDKLAPAAVEAEDWEGMGEAIRRIDDAVTALPLYTNAVEGSRSGKRKKKTDTQKEMTANLKVYGAQVAIITKAVEKKDKKKALEAISTGREALLRYRQLAKIDSEDGGVIEMPLGNAAEAGHAGAPLGYVVPAFRGGGISMDYALRDGEQMMKNGMITDEYRKKYQKQ